MNSSAGKGHRLLAIVVPVVLPAESGPCRRPWTPGGCWRWRHDGYSGRHSREPEPARRKAASHRPPTRPSRPASGSAGTPPVHADGDVRRRSSARPRRTLSPGSAGTSLETSVTAPGPAGKTRAGRRSSFPRPARCRRREPRKWMCGWCVRDCPQVCSTPRKPISAPRCFGSAAMVRNVSDAARNRMSYTTVWFWNAMTSICAGTVNTTWKYGTSSSSAWRSCSHWARARPWHFGQLRFRHELYETR